jgi:polysaccharide biosynthesis protein PslG
LSGRRGYSRAGKAHLGRATLGLLLLALAVGLLTAAGASAKQLRGAVLAPSVSGDRPSVTQAEINGQVKAACSLGSSVTRFSINWARLEPSPGRVNPGYAEGVDRMLAALTHCGVTTVLTFIATPCWITSDPAAAAGACTPTSWKYPPRTASAFGDIVSWAVARWGWALAGLEVWNEPNSTAYWQGSVPQYVALANEAAARAHAIGSPVPILAGALWGADAGYLAQLYAAGMHGQGGISIHPYTVRNDSGFSGWVSPVAPFASAARAEHAGPGESLFGSSIARVHNTMLASGDQTPLWLTELGYSVCPAVPFCVSKSKQARWLIESLHAAARLPYVRAALIYSLRDTAASRDWNCRFGLLRLDFSPRPSYVAVRRLLRRH